MTVVDYLRLWIRRQTKWAEWKWCGVKVRMAAYRVLMARFKVVYAEWRLEQAERECHKEG